MEQANTMMDAEKERLFVVLTTIAPPTECVRRLRDAMPRSATLAVVGDTKGPEQYDTPGTTFLPYAAQRALEFQLYANLPTRHYARKNLGYLHAMRCGANCIYETDDDNAPLENWKPRTAFVAGGRRTPPHDRSPDTPKWVNVYQYFSGESIWPRGLPLNEVRGAAPSAETLKAGVFAPIQQGLVNNSPDVDAVWRLTQDRPFSFDDAPSVLLSPGNWCPFNTQSTWWWPIAYPLMYIPSHCSFRMCDIWKSFVAQRCLWELGMGVVFHAAEVVQERNFHELMADFRDEIPGYLGNSQIVASLAKLTLDAGQGNVNTNLIRCYEALVGEGVFPDEELILAKAWVADIEAICKL